MKNKTLAVLSASLLCASASAGTYTWTGAAGDGLYFTAGNWSYDDGSQCVYTDGHVLTVKELTVAGAAKRAGRYTATDLPGLVVGTGAIVVDVMPIVIMVR